MDLLRNVFLAYIFETKLPYYSVMWDSCNVIFICRWCKKKKNIASYLRCWKILAWHYLRRAASKGFYKQNGSQTVVPPVIAVIQRGTTVLLFSVETPHITVGLSSSSPAAHVTVPDHSRTHFAICCWWQLVVCSCSSISKICIEELSRWL